MLSILPEQVKLEKTVAEYPPEQSEISLLSWEGKLPVAWVTRDISKSEVIGDATTATKEKGDRILKSVPNGWVQVIKDIYGY